MISDVFKSGYFVGKKIYRSSPRKIEVRHKYKKDECVDVFVPSVEHIDQAIELGVNAEGLMRTMSSFERKEVLLQLKEVLQRNKETMARVIVMENGKTIRDARGEVDRAILVCDISAAECVSDWDRGSYGMGDIHPSVSGTRVLSTRYPVGLTSCIVPFNFPLNLAMHKIGPAIAVGNPFILKPSDQTPLSAILLGHYLSELNLPDGAFSVLPCANEDAHILSTDDRIKMVSFTGSPQVGWHIKKNSGTKKVALELGGDAANIIDKSADLEFAATRLAWAGFYLSGQSCISAQRIFIHSDVYDQFMEIFIKKVQALKLGDPFDETVDIGPMINLSTAERVSSWIKEAVSGGAKLLAGSLDNDGTFVRPTVLEGVPETCNIATEEVFGPVVHVQKYTDFPSLCKTVNNSKYGLQAGLFTNDIHQIFYAYDHIDVGGLVINDVSATRVDAVPYGGVKNSGLGREGIKAAMEDMSECKTMLIRNLKH